MKPERIRFSSYNDEVSDFIKGLPRGYRTFVIESALLAYMKTDAARTFMAKVESKPRNKTAPRARRPETETESRSVAAKLTGFLNG